LILDKTKFYAIIIDENDKSYQMDCDLKNVNKDELKLERRFKLILNENENFDINFLDEYLDK
jgi:hypothetical protein